MDIIKTKSEIARFIWAHHEYLEEKYSFGDNEHASAISLQELQHKTILFLSVIIYR